MRRILEMLFPPRDDEKVLRDVSDDDFLSLVTPRLTDVTRPGTVVLLPFHDPRVRSAIHEAKYHGNGRACKLLARTLSEYLTDSDDVGRQVSRTFLVPIPLGEKRRKERGFNQIEEIAKQLPKELEFALDPTLLVRTRETVSQVSLPRHKREENMRGAFRAAHSVDPTYLYIVIDDVVTTGATLQAAIDALRAAGAVHIVPLALAH